MVRLKFPPPPATRLRAALRELRRALGAEVGWTHCKGRLPLREACDMLGLPLSSWSNWERGHCIPTAIHWEVVRQAAEARGLSMPPPYEWREVVPEE